MESNVQVFLDRVDRRRKIRKSALVSLFAVLLSLLVVYAVSIERKIAELAERPAVVVYKYSAAEATDESDAIEDSDITGGDAAAHHGNISGEESPIVEVGEILTNEDSYTEKISSGESDSNIKVDEGETSGNVYYVTESGKKYHVSDCHYLSKSKIELSYDEIILEGYEACSICIPKE